jgi:hypothetical protein
MAIEISSNNNMQAPWLGKESIFGFVCFVALQIEFKALCMLRKHSSTELYPQSRNPVIMEGWYSHSLNKHCI